MRGMVTSREPYGRRMPTQLRPAALAALCAGGLLLAPDAPGAATKSRALSATGDLVQTAKPGRFSSIQQGTLRGTPLGSGRMILRSTLKQATVTSTFTVTTKAGRVAGRATARLTVDGDTANYRGTATITSGTDRYRRASGSNIRFTGVGPVSAKRTKITLSGRVRY